ncbi:MAG: hypothetical protein J3K34DRAFT_19063 [Monoraphidium minutum]|nr:MAG: hypothetical protein J3K34DRAFT_19063 [Monoraphidium minutum]
MDNLGCSTDACVQPEKTMASNGKCDKTLIIRAIIDTSKAPYYMQLHDGQMAGNFECTGRGEDSTCLGSPNNEDGCGTVSKVCVWTPDISTCNTTQPPIDPGPTSCTEADIDVCARKAPPTDRPCVAYVCFLNATGSPDCAEYTVDGYDRDGNEVSGTRCEAPDATTEPCSLGRWCNGDVTCPATPLYYNSSTPCGGDRGVCDAGSKCDGSSATCPNAYRTGAECGAPAPERDPASSNATLQHCIGNYTCKAGIYTCPTVRDPLTDGTTCANRGARGECADEAKCNGTDYVCPDVYRTGAECGAPAPERDPASSNATLQHCIGNYTCKAGIYTCPTVRDPLTDGTTCANRGARGECADEAKCNGTDYVCPDVYRTGAECGAPAPERDPASSNATLQHCIGNYTCKAGIYTCPTVRDPLTDGTTCANRGARGECADEAKCNGTDYVCPDVYRTGAECGAPAPERDPASSNATLQHCIGNYTCKAGIYTCPTVRDPLTDGTTCANQGVRGDCGGQANCSGSDFVCPDAYLGGETECRNATNPCDLPETCTGSSYECPEDWKRHAYTYKCGTVVYACGVDTSSGLFKKSQGQYLVGAPNQCNTGKSGSLVILSSPPPAGHPADMGCLDDCAPKTCNNEKGISNSVWLGCVVNKDGKGYHWNCTEKREYNGPQLIDDCPDFMVEPSLAPAPSAAPATLSTAKKQKRRRRPYRVVKPKKVRT